MASPRPHRPVSLLVVLGVLLLLCGVPTATAANNNKNKNKNKKQQNNKQQQNKKQQNKPAVVAMEDTAENRRFQATRVLKGTPIEETLEALADEAAKIKGEEHAAVRFPRLLGVGYLS